jgi:cupin fold WbuC family metalloprotein
MSMKIVTPDTLSDLLARAAASPHKRTNLNLHPKLEDPINRFLNAGLPGTYVCPHRHRIHRWELVNVLQGKLDLITFDSEGKVKLRCAFDPQRTSLIEIPGGDWHTFIFHPPGAVVLEIKPGPYEPQLDKEFAAWAPAEGDPAAPSFMTWLESAAIGEAWRG